DWYKRWYTAMSQLFRRPPTKDRGCRPAATRDSPGPRGFGAGADRHCRAAGSSGEATQRHLRQESGAVADHAVVADGTRRVIRRGVDRIVGAASTQEQVRPRHVLQDSGEVLGSGHRRRQFEVALFAEGRADRVGCEGRLLRVVDRDRVLLLIASLDLQ